MPKTIGQSHEAMVSAQATSESSTAAAVAASAKATSDLDAFNASKVQFAADLKVSGDYFHLNADGTAVAYFTSPTSPDGFFSEVLKGEETVVDASVPPVTPPDQPAAISIGG